ncbi:hypothetical protein [Chamaesiphon polymorphus]|uniref:Uncharacterized protein n=1 Tax=Chamaesiphon polymorphus CCALA 037 TaxID=2107692 RepID=A0A2T1GLY5_9CYAN|nr:hypothetical protein [Chamaesiphon polymorphus]PSB58888.1 hypothetical protein C7B77_02945 [Chamaesiphon polymorphus CCALA 037]
MKDDSLVGDRGSALGFRLEVGDRLTANIIWNIGDRSRKVVENTDRTNPNVPKLSDDRGGLGRSCQGDAGGATSVTPSDNDRSLWDRYFKRLL